jgi:tripartite-type tricarboxylate transporter receptor subunit TctC
LLPQRYGRTMKRLKHRLHQPFVIDNRPGGGTNIGTEAVVRAASDGYTLLLASTPNTINATLYKAGVEMVHVPYRSGGPALTDLLAGQVQVMFPATVSSIEYIRAGRLRALAVTTATRSELLPDIPTVAEFVAGYEASNWFGICAPKATPAEIVEKLNKEINASLADPSIKARLADLGGDVLALSPADFGKLIAEDTEKWGKVIRAANIKAE